MQTGFSARIQLVSICYLSLRLPSGTLSAVF